MVNIFFRGANFGIFIGFIVYVYQRYGKSRIMQKMDHEHRIITGLQSEEAVAISIYAEYKEKVIHQKEQMERLEQSIIEWQKSVAHDQMRRLLEKNGRVVALKNKTDAQTQQMHRDMITHTIMPGAVEHARTALEQLFTDAGEGALFVERIIVRLRASDGMMRDVGIDSGGTDGKLS
jgi:hypothetical protein